MATVECEALILWPMLNLTVDLAQADLLRVDELAFRIRKCIYHDFISPYRRSFVEQDEHCRGENTATT